MPLSPTPSKRRLRPVAAVAVLLALWGCTSTPLPPYVPASPPAPVIAPAPPPAPTPMPTPVDPAVTAPIRPGPGSTPAGPGTLPPAAPEAAASAPYGAAVAARFAEPAVTPRTPAFETGRSAYTSNAELRQLLRLLVREAGPNAAQVRLLGLGSSQAGEPIEALLFTRSPDPSAAALRAGTRPTVLLIGQQHGDEPAGAEALIELAQELAAGRLAALLERINVIVLPRANPDGAAQGTRVSASGLDINRDHLLLKTPEAQAQAQLVRDYRPVVVIDAHEYTVVGRYLQKFGTVQRYDALLQYATTANLPEFITRAAEEWFRRPMLAALKAQGLAAEWYYTTSTDLADKKISMGGTQPDTGRNVNGLTNAISILVETRGVGIGRLHFKRRVQTHLVAVGSVLQSAADRAADLLKLRDYVDNEVSALACRGEVVVEAAATSSEYALTMLDPVTGADKVVNVAWDSALELRTLKQRTRPCGYWLAANETDAVQRLRARGVLVQRIDDKGVVRGELYRETAREAGVRQDVRGAVFDGGGVLRVQVEMLPALLDVVPGSWYVPLDQPLANLIVAALEPDTQNSYLANRIVTDLAGQARVMARPEFRLSVLP
jgi:hypothetical protein